MRLTRTTAVLPLIFLLACTAINAFAQEFDPDSFFHQYAGLNDDQIQAIRHGHAVAKVMDSPIADQVIVVGAVYVESTPEKYLQLAGDIDLLRKLPGYLAIRKFSDPPQLSDLDGLTFEPDDIKDLKNCRPGHCAVQLPAEIMEEFQRSVNWSASDVGVADQVNRKARELALQALLQYMQGGNSALGVYRDKDHPTQVEETFRALLGRVKSLPEHLPELERYLLDYPGVNLPNAQSEFYWEKVNFGLKPTVRVVQRIVYRGVRPEEPAYVVVEKQLYSSHYFQTALDLTGCMKAAGPNNQQGFYLITLKGSQQRGLTGFKGSIVRKVAVGKTRSSLERTLSATKQKLEASPE